MNFNMTNSSFNLTSMVDMGNLWLGCWYTFISILIIGTNGIVMLVIAKTRALHLPTLWVIANMAFWDLMIGLDVLFAMAPCAFLGHFIYPEVGIGICACLNTFLLGQNIFNTFVIVADRFIAIKFPFSYLRIATLRNYVLVTSVTIGINCLRVFLIALADSDFYFHPLLKMCVFNYDKFRETIPSVVPIIIVLLLIIIGSCVLLKDVIRIRQRICQDGGPDRRSPQVKFTLMVVCAATIFCVSYFPTFGSILWNFFQGQGSAASWLLVLACVTQLSCSVCNVVIYTVTYRPFRESLFYLFCRSYYRNMMRNRFNISSHRSSREDDVAPTTFVMST